MSSAQRSAAFSASTRARMLEVENFVNRVVPSSGDVTRILIRVRSGDQEALSTLMPLVYGELKRMAAAYMRREGSEHTLQPTALVHEAYFRLADQKIDNWQNRAHFYGVAAQCMRRILVDHARSKAAEKRGGDRTAATLSAVDYLVPEDTPDLVALSDALDLLAEINERQANVVEMRFFGGLSVEETAEALGASPATVKRDWSYARAWLKRQLQQV